MPSHRTTNKFQKAVSDFRSARQRAAMENILDRLTGKSTGLLSYKDVAQKLKIVNQAERGVRDIPVESIVGSVGRYTDFSRTFLPMQESDATRWARVASVPDFHRLPPIDVYQIGEVYFVLDGNHRVSIARQRGMLFIPAAVTEVRTRAPIPPDVSPDKLILQAEYVAFLENTNLDELRPDASLFVSVPGQYRKLENHMEVYRFFIEMEEEVELPDEEAVTRWYDEAYLPVVKAVREQGILRGFPNRSETDLYIWISEHQANLRNELGWKISPEVATADLAGRVESEAGSIVTQVGKKIGRSILNLVVSDESKSGAQPQSWSQTRVAARYSDRLFADLLVVLPNELENQAVLEQAIIIAELDSSRLHGLSMSAAHEAASQLELAQWFERQCQTAGIEGRLASKRGDPIQTVFDWAALADLIVCGRFPLDPNSELDTNQQLLSLIRQSPRPVLISMGTPAAFNNILLAYDGGTKSKEALFVAAYMAERWGAHLTVVLAPEEGGAEDADIIRARTYLEMHEVEAEFVVCEQTPIKLVLETAQEKGSQLIIAGGYSRRRFGRRGSGEMVKRLLAEWQGAVLICP